MCTCDSDSGPMSALLNMASSPLASAPVPTVFAKVISGACCRLPNLSRPGGMARLNRLIAAGAWADAALVLIELELPAWSLRRLIREDDEWFCSLSRQPNVPVALDVTAHAHHAGSHHATSGKHTPA
jgi:hypothetical protein